MKNVFNLLTIILPLFCLSALVRAQSGNWELKKDKDGIRVYTREVEDSALDEFKGIASVNADVEEIVSLLKDVGLMTEWLPDCKEAHLEKMEDNHQYHYSVTHTPFPVRNRDSYVHYEYQPTENGMKVVMEALPDYKPHKGGHVRIPYLSGYWLLENEGNTTKVTYQVHADPGGSIPNWLANATAVNNPFETLKNMREKLENN